MSMSREEVSNCRKRLKELLNKIEKLAFHCAYPDDLVQGVASEAFKRCGKKGCKCLEDISKRHGPYLIIQLYEDKKQRHVALRNEEKHLWQLVKNYQFQINSLSQLKKTCGELCSEVDRAIKKRLKKLERDHDPNK